MKRYIYLSEDDIVIEIINEFDEMFPNISINKRYSQEFLNKCVVVEDENILIEQHYRYDRETNTFYENIIENVVLEEDQQAEVIEDDNQ